MPNDNYTGAGSASYTNYAQDHHYENETGLVVLPVASTVAKRRIIRLHGGTGTRRVQWTASRKGKPPIIPVPETTAYDTLIASRVTPALPSPDPNTGGYNWTISGEYVYSQVKPRQVGTDTLPTGAFPFVVGVSDTLAATLAAPFLAVFQAAQAGSLNPFDAVVKAISANLSHESDTFFWPFTYLPPAFTNDNLIAR